MKKRFVLMMAALLAVLVLRPVGSEAATSLDKINKDLDSAKKQIEEAQRSADEADKKIDGITAKKEDVKTQIEKLVGVLNDVNDNMNATQVKVDAKEKELQQTGKELEEAEDRVEKRDQLLQSRLRLMYSTGFVSYLDVLLSSTSFSDFLDRFDALKSILRQDRDILEQHKKDKALVEEKKAQVTQQLEEVKTMYAKLTAYKAELKKREKEKEVLIASYNQEIEELEEITAEQEQALISLAKQVSELESQKKKLSAISRPYTGGKLGMPIVDYTRISSPFGTRIHPVTGVKKMHTGIDFAAPKGTDIYAAESGVVILAQSWSGYGNAVIIDHGNNLWTLYGHIRDNGTLVSNGDTVKKGQKIAEVGMTGTATGYHLHFEVRVNGDPVNPSSYLK